MRVMGFQMKKNRVFLTIIFLCSFASFSAWSFNCKTTGGVLIPAGGGNANVYVTLTPSLGVNSNLIVDLSKNISCNNQLPSVYVDYVSLQSGSAFGGVLSSFQGTVDYDGSSYTFPTKSETPKVIYDSLTFKPWPVKLNLTPISTAGGVVITSGSLIARMVLHQTNNFNDSASYVWNIYANNDVVIPTGGCDVSSRDVTVTLPNYPGTQTIPLTVYCASPKALSYYLTGTTTDTESTIFSNTSSASPAQGLGIQLSNSSGVLATNKNVSLGNVGTSPVSLGLTASYARTSGQVAAGNVQSIVGVTFVYQ